MTVEDRKGIFSLPLRFIFSLFLTTVQLDLDLSNLASCYNSGLGLHPKVEAPIPCTQVLSYL